MATLSSTGRFAAGEACADNDILYGPYATTEAAHAALLNAEQNVVGRTVGIQTGNTIEEYWYQGGTEQANLVKKQTASIEVDSELSPTSENPVQNKVVKSALDAKANASDIPSVPTISTNIESDANSDTKTASPKAVKTFVEGKGYLTQHQDISGKVDKVSGATPNNFASFDENGGIKDSGKKDTDFATAAQGTKADNAIPMPTGTDGQILEKDSNETSGVKWVNKPSDGQDGASSYELYEQAEIAAGRTPLSQEAWLASLKANIGAFQFITPTDTTAEAALTTIGSAYASAIGGVSPTQSTLSIILLMNDSNNTKTMMIATQDDGNSGYEFVYAGDLQSAMPSDVVTTDMIDDEPIAGSENLIKSGGVEKYLAQDILTVPDPSRTNRTFVSYNGQVETIDAYSVVKGIELAPGDIIFLNQGNGLYTSATGAVLFETDSEGNFTSPFNCIFKGVGGWIKVSYKNTGSSTIYVGLCAYDYSTYRQCGYKIWKGNKVAAADEDLQSEIQRATQAENNKLSFTESQSLTPEQKTQALSNLGIFGTETTVNPKSNKVPTSSAVYEAISQRSKILTLVGNGTTYVTNGAVVDGFIPGHTYRFTILNYDEWELPTTLTSTNSILKIYAYNNKECVYDVANGKYRRSVSVEYQYQQFTSSPQRINRTFDYIFYEKINETDIYNWYIKVEGRASSGCVLKISAEDITGIEELEKDNKINGSSDEWVAFDGGDGYVWGLLPNASTMKLYLYTGQNNKGYYYKAKAGDVIRVRLSTGYDFSGGIIALMNYPREDAAFTYLLQTNSLSTVNSSTITITEDCYVYFNYIGSAIVYVKNTGANKKLGDVEEEISNIHEDINEIRSGSTITVVTDSTAFLDKKLILNEGRTYYFNDTYASETSYEDTSYLDRKIMQVPEGKHFIFVTDSHIDYFPQNNDGGIGFRQKETEVIKYVRDRLGIKNVIFGGDCIGKQQTKYKAVKVLSLYANEKFESFGSDFLFVMGNHDTNNFTPNVGTIEDARISDVEVYKRTTKYMKEYGKAVFPTKLINIIDTSNDILDNAGNVLTQSQKEEFKAWAMMNYYYDDDRQKIRYIVLESGDGGNTMNEIFGTPGDSQNSLLTVGYFFIDALNSVPQDYDVVVSVHWIGLDGRFWNRVYYKLMALYKNKQSSTVSFIPSHQNVENIVEKTFDNPSTFNIPVDFRNNLGSGRIFSISGHNHYDRAGVGSYVADGTITSYSVFPLTTESTPQQLEYTQWSVLCIECDRCCAIERGSGGTPGNTNYRQGAYSYPNDSSYTSIEDGGVQRLGTIKEVLFDVVTITPDNRVVCTRFGAEGEDNGSPYVRDYVLPMRAV